MKNGPVTRNVAALSDPPKAGRPEALPFIEDEASQLLDAVEGTRREALYAVALALGLRVGELLGLRWADVDLKRGKLHVRQQLQHLNGQQPALKPLKTKASRRNLDLPAGLADRLRAHHDRQRIEQHAAGETWQDHRLVFPSTVGTPMILRNLTQHNIKLIARAGLPERRIHDLRHTPACPMFARGLRAAEVKDMLGHSSITITLDTYRY